MKIDRVSDSKPVLAIAATTISTNTTTYGSSIDTQFYNSLVIPLDIDVTTDGQIDSITFQESSDNNDEDSWEDIETQENLFYPDDFPVDKDEQIVVGCVAKERYVRLKIVTTEFSAGNIAIPKTLGLLMDSMTKPMRKESSVIEDDDVIAPGKTADAVTTPPKRT